MEKFKYSICSLYGVQAEACESSRLEGPYEDLKVNLEQLTSLLDVVRAAERAEMGGPWAQEILSNLIADAAFGMQLQDPGIYSLIETAIHILDASAGLHWGQLTPVSQAILYAVRSELIDYADTPQRERIEAEVPEEMLALMGAFGCGGYARLRPVEKLGAENLPMLCEPCAEVLSALIWRQALRQA